ncbi:MAG: hypothetical protein V2A74_01315 [bacterium]
MSLKGMLSNRRVRMGGLAFLVGAGAVVGFLAWLWARGGSDYTGDLVLLLPEETPAYFVLRDLSGILDRVEGSGLYRRCTEDPNSILVTSKSLRKFVKRTDSAAAQTEAVLGQRFLRRWFGKEVVAAVAPDDEDKNLPGLLVLARTDLGFEEALAELVAQIWPDVRLTSLDYRGVRINRYEAEKAKRAFTYLRFGRTVVFSLRSPDWGPLRSVVDRRLDKPERTLATSRLYLDHLSEIPKFGAGLYGLINSEEAVTQLKSMPGASLEKYLSDSDWEYLGTLAGKYPEVTLRLDGEEKIVLRMEAFPDLGGPPPPEPGNGRVLDEAIKALPAHTLMFLGVAGEDVGPSIWNWFQSLDSGSKLFEDVVKLRSQLTPLESKGFVQDFVRAAGPAFWLTWTDLSLGFALPSVSVQITAIRSEGDKGKETLLSRHAQALGASWQEAEKGLVDLPTILGRFRLEETRKELRASLNPASNEATTSNTLASSALFLELGGGPDRNTILLFYANFEAGARAVGEGAFARSPGAKEFSWLKGLGPLRGAMGRLERIERRGRSFELTVPLN